MTSVLRTLPLMALTLLPVASWSQSTSPPDIPPDLQLLHLDTPVTLDRGVWEAGVNVHVFGNEEDTTYGGGTFSYGLGNRWQATVRGGFSGISTRGLAGGSSIRHGGNDVELLAKVQSADGRPVAGILGVGFANNPAQTDSFFTAGVAGAIRLHPRVTGYLNPRAVFIDNNTLLGVGLGARIEVTRGVAVIGEYTPIVSGDNTRDATTGGKKRVDLYGVAVRLAPAGMPAGMSVDVGYTNTLGSTTGYGLTSGLNGSGAFYAALTVRR